MAWDMADMHNVRFHPTQAPIPVSHRPPLHPNQQTGKNIPEKKVDIKAVAMHHITVNTDGELKVNQKKKKKKNCLSFKKTHAAHKPLPTD